jgi:hypothetical protein
MGSVAERARRVAEKQYLGYRVGDRIQWLDSPQAPLLSRQDPRIFSRFRLDWLEGINPEELVLAWRDPHLSGWSRRRVQFVQRGSIPGNTPQ